MASATCCEIINKRPASSGSSRKCFAAAAGSDHARHRQQRRLLEGCSMIKSDPYNRLCVLTVEGDLAGEDAAILRRIVDDLLSQPKVVDIVIDFEKAEFIDSAGLESLLFAARQCEQAEKRLK